MVNQTIPVALFVYKRLEHLSNTISSLVNNNLSNKVDLYLFSDGPKNVKDKPYVENIRKFIRTLNHFNSITIIESHANNGLSKSIISGVTKVLESHDRAIIIEDDLVLSPYFLTYMIQALNWYQVNSQRGSIHGYTLPVKNPLPDTFFLKGADCWGWGTWKRAWDTFEKDGTRLLNQLQDRKLIKQFDFDGLVGNSQMLKDQIASKNDSWAIRWHASCFLNNMVTLHPGKSLVKNIGLDGSGEHCVADLNLNLNSNLSTHAISVNPIAIKESPLAYQLYKDYYRSIRRSLIKRVVDAIREKI